MKFPKTLGDAIWELMAPIFLHSIISTLLFFKPDDYHVVAGRGRSDYKNAVLGEKVPVISVNRGPRCSALRYVLGPALPISAGTPRSLIFKW